MQVLLYIVKELPMPGRWAGRKNVMPSTVRSTEITSVFTKK